MADGRKLVTPAEPESKVVKRVAKDGTQRGLHMRGRKPATTKLIERIQDAVQRDTGISDWDPVVMMAVVAARAFTGYPATDDDGRPIIDEQGNPVMVPPDQTLAVAAAAKVAPYVHSQLRPKEADSDDGQGDDLQQAKDEVVEALEKMGINFTYDDEEASDEHGPE